MPTEWSRITMERIAAELQVSRTTVYRVAHDKPNVKPETRQAVLELISKYDFHPNIAAQSLVTERTRTIGVIFDNLIVAFRNMLAQYLVQDINERSYRVILLLLDEQHLERFIDLLRRDILGRRIDGLILDLDASSIERSGLRGVVDKMVQRKFPFVFLSAMPNVQGVSFVSIDRALGSYKAVSHLIRLGRRKIAFVSSGFERHVLHLDLRLEGYRRALREAGLAEQQSLLIPIDSGDFDDGYLAGSKLADSPERPDAVFCVNDVVAMGMLKAFREKGVEVPREVAVVGFDNIQASPYGPVPLTTVDQPIREIAAEGVRMLFDRIRDPDMPVKQLFLEPRLVVRSSCGAAGDRPDR